ncbi:hypothetical protein COK55_24420 [Bacillus cereus]|nr:hypothetical protein COK55_24420 [Bacillus cereus]
MNWMLFTISNEQIKESLDKLQTKVESLENMKELQDKVVSMQDHQISFLNDSIANMWQPIAIVAGIAGIIASGAFIYVAYLNRQAQKKVKQAESLINQSQQTATFAQDKLDALETKQQELNDLATTTITNQKYDMSLRQVGITLDLSKVIIDSIYEEIKSPISLKPPTEHIEELSKLSDEYKSIAQKYQEILFDFNSDVISGRKYDPEYIIEGLKYLVPKCTDLYYECKKLKRKFNKYE